MIVNIRGLNVEVHNRKQLKAARKSVKRMFAAFRRTGHRIREAEKQLKGENK